MDLLSYIKNLPDDDARNDFAKRCDTTLGYLRQVAYGNKQCGEKIVIAIERESHGQVLCETLRPDVDWAYIRGATLAPVRAIAGARS